MDGPRTSASMDRFREESRVLLDCRGNRVHQRAAGRPEGRACEAGGEEVSSTQPQERAAAIGRERLRRLRHSATRLAADFDVVVDGKRTGGEWAALKPARPQVQTKRCGGDSAPRLPHAVSLVASTAPAPQCRSPRVRTVAPHARLSAFSSSPRKSLLPAGLQEIAKRGRTISALIEIRGRRATDNLGMSDARDCSRCAHRRPRGASEVRHDEGSRRQLRTFAIDLR